MPKTSINKAFTSVTASERKLINRALAVQKRAYAPYSRFKVGAAILGKDGCIYVGCNVENASYGATVCAERNAVAQALVAGCRRFMALAVVSPSSPPASPCGLCRQVLSEFDNDMPIVLANSRGELVRTSLSILLPLAFSSKKL
jgi:cytidine deaminase